MLNLILEINPRFWSVFSCIIFSLKKDEDFGEDDTEKEEVAAEQKINRRKNFYISCSFRFKTNIFNTLLTVLSYIYINPGLPGYLVHNYCIESEIKSLDS